MIRRANPVTAVAWLLPALLINLQIHSTLTIKSRLHNTFRTQGQGSFLSSDHTIGHCSLSIGQFDGVAANDPGDDYLTLGERNFP